MKTSLLGTAGLILTIGLASCNFPGVQPTEDNLATAAAETVAAQLTEAAGTVATTPPDAATDTPGPPASETPVPSATSTATPACTNKVSFVKDVTIPDDTNIPAGDTFDKTWRLRNSGSCSWTTDYDVVFESGNIMAGPPSSPLAGSVPPNAEVDITISLTAPNADGTHRGNWLLRDADGVLFGLGVDSDVPFFVQIVVGATPTPAPEVVNDFVANYCDAEWVSGAGALPCPGSDTDPEGFVIKLDSPKLENGTTENEPALLTHPEWVNNGVISGRFPSFEVKEGDHFLAVIGCLFNGLSCDVRFQLNYRENGGALQNLGQWDQSYDGGIQKIDLDLSDLAGKSVQFAFAVLSNGPSNQDWAFWLAPRIVGPPR
jgi:hypothetical protein